MNLFIDNKELLTNGKMLIVTPLGSNFVEMLSDRILYITKDNVCKYCRSVEGCRPEIVGEYHKICSEFKMDPL